MLELVLIAAGSAAGGVCRFLLARLVDQPGGMPWGTILVNVLGCLAIGLVAASLSRDWVRPLVMIGFLGGFTTFSSFALQSLTLLQQGRPLLAAANVGLSLVACLAGVWAGWGLGVLLRPAPT